jgi:CBS domain-containing protein
MDTVRNILSAKGGEVVNVGPEATVLEALVLMSEKNVGAIMVMGAGGEVLGLFSERDFARKIILKGRSCDSTKVKEIMSTKIIYAHPDSTIDECMNLMTDRHFRHLPVKDGEKLVGVVSIGDIVKAMLKQKERIISEQAFEIGQNERKTSGAV